jgi:hypothetical protein
MNAQRDPERLIHAFLLDGAEQLDDQVYDAVRASIEHKRQRVVFGPWRTPIMNKLVPIGLGAAAVVVALVVTGAQLLGPPAPSGVGGAPSAEPSATPSPAVTPEPTSTPEGLLPEGSHVLWEEGVPMRVTIPAHDWYGEPGEGILTKNSNVSAPDGAGLIVFESELFVYGDPCRWSTTKPDTPAATVDELVAALAAQASRDASAPVDVTVDGYAGKSITLHVPDDAVFSDCDQGEFRTLVMGISAARYHQDPGQIDVVWILDVDGVPAVVDWAYYAGTPTEHVEELRAIVESITFE